jgi:prevent-host-death family protein
MDIVRAEDLAQRFEELIERVAAGERIIVSDAGRQVALVSFDDLAFLEGVDQELDERDAAEARRRLADRSQSPVPFVAADASPQATGKP